MIGKPSFYGGGTVAARCTCTKRDFSYARVPVKKRHLDHVTEMLTIALCDRRFSDPMGEGIHSQSRQRGSKRYDGEQDASCQSHDGIHVVQNGAKNGQKGLQSRKHNKI